MRPTISSPGGEGSGAEVPSFLQGVTVLTERSEIVAALRSPATVMRRETPPQLVFGTILAVDGAEHAALRRPESALFTPHALAMYEQTYLTPLVGRMIDERRSSAAPVGLDLVGFSTSALARVGCSIAGVIDAIDGDDDVEVLLDLLDALSAAATVEFAKVDAAGYDAIVERGLDALTTFETRFFDVAAARRLDMIDEVRRGERHASDLPSDVLTTLLLRDRAAPDDGLRLREVVVYLLASIKTSVRALCNCADELFRWLAHHPDDAARTTDEAFLRGAVHEALRLHPVLPLLVRAAADSITLPTGRVLREGERFAIRFGPADRDPAVHGDDSDRFDPHRLERTGAKQGYGLAFGSGPHTCIGRRLAVGGAPPAGADEPPTRGSLLTILLRLFEAGMRPDPDHPPVRKANTFYEEFTAYPVLLVPDDHQPGGADDGE